MHDAYGNSLAFRVDATCTQAVPFESLLHNLQTTTYAYIQSESDMKPKARYEMSRLRIFTVQSLGKK